ncbi:hypothetical protein BK819_16120 [Microbacterium sp. LCT-H2]|nr:hypothetical protein BK819_16120 [Microbacterium sp. LCT-H2]
MPYTRAVSRSPGSIPLIAASVLRSTGQRQMKVIRITFAVSSRPSTMMTRGINATAGIARRNSSTGANIAWRRCA